MNRTTAMVLTFNRLALLKECIDSLRKQTVPADQIIVVNNASSDGTAEWLADQADLQVITTDRNLGGSAGFHRGIQEAYAHGSDWIWLMDDDAFPEAHCLENLYKVVRSKNTNKMVLAPLVIEGDEVDHMHRGHINFKKINFPLQVYTSDHMFKSPDPLVDITFASFIGMFIGREIVSQVNLPHPQYFIFQDDLEYSIRITKAGFPIHLVKNAIVHHKKKGTSPYGEIAKVSLNGKNYQKPKRTFMQIYMDKRNKYTDADKINLLLFISKRNWLWTIMQHNGMNLNLFLFLMKDVFRNSTYVLLSKSNNRLLLHLFYHMYKQGLSGKFDNSSILSARSA